MIRRALMGLIGKLASSSVLSPISQPLFASRANIVYYHGVWRRASTSYKSFGGLTLEAFERDMKLLCRYFSPISLCQLLDLNARGEVAQGPLFAVTFDDGCDLTRSGATDVLDSLGIPATTFVVLDCVGNRHLMWQHKFSAIRAARGDDVFVREFNRVASTVRPGTAISSAAQQVSVSRTWPMRRKDEYADEIWRACDMPSVQEFLAAERPYVDWEDLEDWQRRGHDVGLHTKTHPFCSRLDADQIVDEIKEPAVVLAKRIGRSAVPFAYPFGDRLAEDTAKDVLGDASVSCLLGIDGLSALGTPAHHLGRACGEEDVNVSVFARPLANAVRSSITA